MEERGQAYLTHGAEEGLHASTCEPPCWRRLQEDSTELHGGTVREVERDDGLQPGKNEVQRTMMPSGMGVS